MRKNFVRPAKTPISLHNRKVWSVFAFLMKYLCILCYPKRDWLRVWSGCANVEHDLNLRWAHMSKCTFADASKWLFCCSSHALALVHFVFGFSIHVVQSLRLLSMALDGCGLWVWCLLCTLFNCSLYNIKSGREYFLKLQTQLIIEIGTLNFTESVQEQQCNVQHCPRPFVEWCSQTLYKSTPIQIYRKFHHQKLKLFHIKNSDIFIFLLKT